MTTTVRIHFSHAERVAHHVADRHRCQPDQPGRVQQGRQGRLRSEAGRGRAVPFVEWQSGHPVALEKYPDYWSKGADGQALPYLDKLDLPPGHRRLGAAAGAQERQRPLHRAVQGKDIAGIKAEPTLTHRGVARRRATTTA